MLRIRGFGNQEETATVVSRALLLLPWAKAACADGSSIIVIYIVV